MSPLTAKGSGARPRNALTNCTTAQIWSPDRDWLKPGIGVPGRPVVTVRKTSSIRGPLFIGRPPAKL